MLVELAVVSGPHAGRTFRFTEHAAFLVGRSAQAHFPLPDKDPHVSRLHLLIEVNPPLVRAKNMSRTNGTRVNGAAIDTADLKAGDRISLGMTELLVSIESEELPTHPMPAGPSDRPTVTAPAGSLPPPTAEALPPDIPGYRIAGVLGKGGMGVVYRAVHEDSGEAVAIKTILPRAVVPPAVLTRFVREIDILKKLAHLNIVRFRDSGTADGCAWLAMELVNGTDAQAAASAGPLATGRAVGWVVQALEALAHAHRRGFVHRDVKPQNILVDARSGGDVVKLADFGLARVYEASRLSGVTLTNAAGGTPQFMPPEQVRDMRSVQPPADQYAAAATLYRLLAGRHVYPKTADVGELFGRILTTDPDPLAGHRPDLPADLVSAVHRALRREPGERFADCTAFANALRPFV